MCGYEGFSQTGAACQPPGGLAQLSLVTDAIWKPKSEEEKTKGQDKTGPPENLRSLCYLLFRDFVFSCSSFRKPGLMRKHERLRCQPSLGVIGMASFPFLSHMLQAVGA